MSLYAYIWRWQAIDQKAGKGAEGAQYTTIVFDLNEISEQFQDKPVKNWLEYNKLKWK